MTFLFKSMSHSGSNPLQLPQGMADVSKELALYCNKVRNGYLDS